MRFAFIIPCAAAAMLAGCITNDRVKVEVGSEDLSGTYRFEGLRRTRPEQFPNALIDWADVAQPSEVRFEQTGKERLVVRYTDTAGRLVEKEVGLRGTSGASFKRGVLTFREQVPLVDSPIFPGLVKQYAGAKYLQDEDGNLRVIGFFTERGLMLYVFPFIDYHEYDLVLEAVER